MNNKRYFAILLVLFLCFTRLAWAAPAGSTVKNIRTSQTAEKVRIVFDVDKLPQYTVSTSDDQLQLVLDMPDTVNKSGLPQLAFNDDKVSGLHFTKSQSGSLQAVVELKTAAMHKVFTLTAPNRVVIDIIKTYDQKVEQQLVSGVTYTSWLRGRGPGPVWAHIVDISPLSGYTLRPVLSNDAVQGLEQLSPMAARVPAVAAVNGSFFNTDGQILGLLKIDGEIVSTPDLARTAFGILPDGKMMIDQVAYQGTVTLPDGTQVAINGVNRERGEDELILYNSAFGASTGSNEFGQEYVVTDNKVTAINKQDTALEPGSIVLSVHGKAAQMLAGLKVGSTVVITQTLGHEWDQTVHALGAGPMLVKNGSVFLTTKLEEFGSDVAGGRAPRTALGLTSDGHILLVVVDGRRASSIGFTLLELANFMQELGCVTAMNLDGGGSSEMIVQNRVVNTPSDGRERRIGDALAVVPVSIAK